MLAFFHRRAWTRLLQSRQATKYSKSLGWLVGTLAASIWGFASFCGTAYGDESLPVPAVIGKSAKEAKQTLEAAGLMTQFQVGPAAVQPADAFKVLDVSPRPGTTVKQGSTVRVTVAAQPAALALPSITVPDVLGLPASEARAAITAAGLAAKFKLGRTARLPEEALRAYACDPAPGRRVAEGTIVALTIYSNMLTAADEATRKQAESGSAAEQFEVARRYSLAEVPLDLALARKWMQKAAEQGHTGAQLSLGKMLLDGVGGDSNAEQGRQWLEKAANNGVQDAQYELGLALYHGRGLKADPATAAKWLYRAANRDHGPAQFVLGCIFETSVPPDHASALSWLRKAASNGVAEAPARIGTLYLNGWGVEADDAQAFGYFLQAAGAGDTASQYDVGVLYRDGFGTASDPTRARYWFEIAANNGEARAQNELGLMYQTGAGGAADKETAARWFQKSADRGNPVAEYNLAHLLSQDQKLAEAAAWYRKAADHGIAEAQYQLGMLYANGYGVKPSRAEAMLWYLRAALQGHPQAQVSMRKLLAETKAPAPESK